MTTPVFEAFLARLYVDPDVRARFLADPEGEARRAGLSPDQCRALAAIDRVGLEMAARSFARKRGHSYRNAMTGSTRAARAAGG